MNLLKKSLLLSTLTILLSSGLANVGTSVSAKAEATNYEVSVSFTLNGERDRRELALVFPDALEKNDMMFAKWEEVALRTVAYIPWSIGSVSTDNPDVYGLRLDRDRYDEWEVIRFTMPASPVHLIIDVVTEAPIRNEVSISYTVDSEPVNGVLADVVPDEIGKYNMFFYTGDKVALRSVAYLPGWIIGVSTTNQEILDLELDTEHYDEWEVIRFTMPSSEVHLIIDITNLYSMPSVEMKPADYGFKEQYFFEEKTETHMVNNLPLQTTRLRAGFIDKSHLVLSARRANAGTAYMSYKLGDKLIKRISIDLALWSDAELLRSKDCTAVIQYRYGFGEWQTALDLLNDITLTTNRTNPVNYTVVFHGPATEFRIHSTAPQIGASNNTGRLCIGNLRMFY